jgi:hypothetical protein
VAPQLIVFIWIIIVLLSALFLDMWLLRHYGGEGTITQTIRNWAAKWPTVIIGFSLSMGLLLGHFFLCPSPCDPIVETVDELLIVPIPQHSSIDSLQKET